MPTPKYAVCLTTVPNKKIAEKIARKLVDKKLAACVNIIPGVSSLYRWEKKLRHAGEVVLLIKTSSSKIRDLENGLKRIHPYEVPEFLVIPVSYGLKSYLEWILQET